MNGESGAGGSNARLLFAQLTGLIPMLLAAIPFSLSMWALGLLIYFAAATVLIGRQLLLRERIGSMDVFSMSFFFVLGLAYVWLGNVFCLQHFGAVINAVLLAQVLYGEVRRQPWTLQFTRRMYPPELWNDRVFLNTNRLLSDLWGIIFAFCVVSASLGSNGWFRAILPTALPIVAIALSPRFGRWYGQRARTSASRNRVRAG
jgi:hypothetical protein